MHWTRQAHDWTEVANQIGAKPALRDPWPGVRLLWWMLLLGSAIVYGRLVWIELATGPSYRGLAAKPIERRISIPARRGRILARDGQVLAQDESIACVALQYRWLEEPYNPAWLRQTARSRLTAAERRQPQRCAAEEQRVLAERVQLHCQLAKLCELSGDEWRRRCERAQQQVIAIRDAVNSARRQRWLDARDTSSAPADSMWQLVRRVLIPSEHDAAPEPITVAEELEFHVLCDDLPPDVADSIRQLGHRNPAVRVLIQQRRRYPFGATAAHLVGYLGLPENDDRSGLRIGRTGLEAQFEPSLQSRAGTQTEHLRRSGALIASYVSVEPEDGRDLRITLDVQLQQAAEALLTDALTRSRSRKSQIAHSAGAALIVVECATGAVLTAASLPGFDPNLFEQRDNGRITAILNDPAHPLLDRTIQMQIPPGSVLKVLTALALLDHGLDARRPYDCQGYLLGPHQQRCAIFARYGAGHGSISLHEALAQSCNCYFFHNAGRSGPEPLVRWGEEFGFGAATGIELPFEATGRFPRLADIQKADWRAADTQALAIGQGAVTATPMQIARLMAFVACGALVSPRLLLDQAGTSSYARPSPVRSNHLQVVRAALFDAVFDQHGTAHFKRHASAVDIAGKTGTAQAGGDLPDHAWFAGYAPAMAPEVALVVVVEHGGEASQTAVPVANKLIEQMRRLGYFTGSSEPRNTWQTPSAAARPEDEDMTPLVQQ